MSEITYWSDVDLSRRYGTSRVTVWRWVREGRLPVPLRIGPNCSRWRSDEILAAEEHWMAEREGRLAAAGG